MPNPCIKRLKSSADGLLVQCFSVQSRYYRHEVANLEIPVIITRLDGLSLLLEVAKALADRSNRTKSKSIWLGPK